MPDVLQATSAAPDWSHVHFDVSCGRCGERLNGVTGNHCPACNLPLDWHEVLPVENIRCPACTYNLIGLREPRCPECGHTFDWEQVLHLARSGSEGLFERQWLSKPIRSLLKTLWLSWFRPARLWSSFDVHDAPQIIPLVLLIAVQMLLFTVGWDLAAIPAKWFMDLLAEWNGSRIRFIYNFRLPRQDLLFLLYWYIGTFLGFQVFILSKRLFRVRWQQTLRIMAHATAPLALASMAWCAVEMCMDIVLLVRPNVRWTGSNYYMAGQIVMLTAVLWSCTYVWMGYARYLKTPRGWGIALMSVALGHCAARLVIIVWH